MRYQGGNNAGHTVINQRGKFILNLLPSGILRENVVNVMGNGMVIDLEHLCGEIGRLADAGVAITPDNLKISDRAVICLPYHVQQDCLEEDRLGDAKFGSTRRGIAPVYGDKYLKKALRMGDLLEPEALRARLEPLVAWKNLTIRDGLPRPAVAGGGPLAMAETSTAAHCGTISAIPASISTGLPPGGKRIMFEAQLGALRDIDFGIYPYTSSSSTIAAYAPIGAGIPGHSWTR